MQSTNSNETAAPTATVREPAELNERELSQVAGGLACRKSGGDPATEPAPVDIIAIL